MDWQRDMDSVLGMGPGSLPEVVGQAQGVRVRHLCGKTEAGTQEFGGCGDGCYLTDSVFVPAFFTSQEVESGSPGMDESSAFVMRVFLMVPWGTAFGAGRRRSSERSFQSPCCGSQASR